MGHAQSWAARASHGNAGNQMSARAERSSSSVRTEPI